MTNEESRKLRAVYAAALQRDPEEREAYLDEVCAGQPELRARLDTLLEAHSRDPAGPPSPSPAPPRPAHGGEVEGKVIGPYIIRRTLGQGGMGIVYLADDKRLLRRVALKAIAPGVGHEADNRKRLRAEARAAAGLSHPGIATVYALEEIDDELYLATEYVPGESLRALLASGPLAIRQVIDIGAQLVRALAAAHAIGVIHRDIKPENVVKTPSGAIKILDFGLARVEGGSQLTLTRTGVVVGTPAYMAPEQALGRAVDFRTDLFAVGLLIYELATGVNPFAASTISTTIARIVDEEPPPLSAVQRESTPALDRIVSKCLRKNPTERHRSTQELVADFEELEGEISGRRRGEPTTDRRWTLHQLIVSAIYVVTIYPTWYVRRMLPPPMGIFFLLIVLAAAAAGTSLRLHLVFVARYSPVDLRSQLTQSRRLTRWCDAGFAVALILGVLGLGSAHSEFAMLFVTIAIAMLVATLVIEPATARTAFGPML